MLIILYAVSHARTCVDHAALAPYPGNQAGSVAAYDAQPLVEGGPEDNS